MKQCILAATNRVLLQSNINYVKCLQEMARGCAWERSAYKNSIRDQMELELRVRKVAPM